MRSKNFFKKLSLPVLAFAAMASMATAARAQDIMNASSNDINEFDRLLEKKDQADSQTPPNGKRPPPKASGKDSARDSVKDLNDGTGRAPRDRFLDSGHGPGGQAPSGPPPTGGPGGGPEGHDRPPRSSSGGPPPNQGHP